MIDVARALKTASTTGEIRFGLEQTRRSLKSGEAKMIVVSSNCPARSELVSSSSVKTYVFPGTNVELGAACGKPYAISALAIVRPGDSNILSVS